MTDQITATNTYASPAAIDTAARWGDDAERAIAGADVKAGTLLTWAGTALTLSSGGILVSATVLDGLERLFLGPAVAAIIVLAVAVDTLLLAVRPNLTGPDGVQPGDRSFLHLAGLDAVDVSALARNDIQVRESTGGSLLVMAGGRARRLAQIALRKHQLVARATRLLRWSMPALAASAILIAWGLAT